MLRAAMAEEKPGEWTLAEHLLAVISDLLAGANWQRAGRKGAPRPKPVSPLAKDQGQKTAQYGGTNLPQDQVLALLRARGPQSDPE